MAKSPLPSIEHLRQLIRREGDKLYWLNRPDEFFRSSGAYPISRISKRWNSQWAGQRAFTAKNSHGYYHGKLIYTPIYAHRVIFALHYGEWPQGEVDHINGIRDDNRIENLRATTRSENQRNAAIPINNKSGHIGVYWMTTHSRWAATIGVDKKIVTLGSFKLMEDAISARKAAEQKYGFHENHGRENLYARR